MGYLFLATNLFLLISVTFANFEIHIWLVF
jgi:hypothetical protein